MDLADIEADLAGRLDLGEIGVDERADDQPRVLEPLHRRSEPRALAREVEPALGRHLRPALGHEHGCVGAQTARDTHHLVGRSHLQIQLHRHQRAEQLDVPIDDVAAVLAQVHGDAVGPAQLGLVGRPDRIGLRPIGPGSLDAPVSRLPDGRDVIDVDAQLNHAQL